MDDQVKALISGKGIFFIGASSSTEPAKEDEVLGHGVLTAAILDGLKDGRAARAIDGIVRVSDLFGYCVNFVRDHARQVPVCLNRTEGSEIIVAFSHPKITSEQLAEVRSKLEWCRENKLLTDQDLSRLEGWFYKDPVPVAGRSTLEAGFIRFVRGELTLPDLELFRDDLDKGEKLLSAKKVDSTKDGPGKSRLTPVEREAQYQNAGVTRSLAGNGMIEQAWDDYRGWAKRARSLQARADRWIYWARTALVATGVLGTLATFLRATSILENSAELARATAVSAVIAAALSLFVGRQALAAGAESGWLRGRATAEALKSECFRFAAAAGDYATSDAEAATAFIERRKSIAARSAFLTPERDPVGSRGDDRRPSRPMTSQWYIENRIDGQIAFYQAGQEKTENEYQRLQLWSFVAGASILAVSAIAAVYGTVYAAWIGTLTTVGAIAGTYEMADRQKQIAAGYAVMTANLERLKERYQIGGMTDGTLVAMAEDMMQNEIDN